MNFSSASKMGVCGVIFETLVSFCEHTTIGGLCNAGLAPSRARKIIWMVIFIVLMIFTVQAIWGVVDTYLAYDVITSTDLSYSSMLSFPAITVCNQNKSVVSPSNEFMRFGHTTYSEDSVASKSFCSTFLDSEAPNNAV